MKYDPTEQERDLAVAKVNEAVACAPRAGQCSGMFSVSEFAALARVCARPRLRVRGYFLNECPPRPLVYAFNRCRNCGGDLCVVFLAEPRNS